MDSDNPGSGRKERNDIHISEPAPPANQSFLTALLHQLPAILLALATLIAALASYRQGLVNHEVGQDIRQQVEQHGEVLDKTAAAVKQVEQRTSEKEK